MAKECPESRDIIERFVRDQVIKSEFSPSRQYVLYSQMRFIARVMKDKLQNLLKKVSRIWLRKLITIRLSRQAAGLRMPAI